MSEKYYLTTPLYYVNSKPHIGHSYTNIAADALVRFQRLRLGREKVYFLTGTDEHGQKIDKAAQLAGKTPQEYTDAIAETFNQLWKTLNIADYDFIRTTQDRHVETVLAVWRRLNDNGQIYKAKYKGYYCVPDETFYTEDVVDAEKLCPDCRRPLEYIEEENYFLKMSDKRAWLIDVIKTNQMKVLPETRKNEVLGFLENNELQDLCISRPKKRLAWGIQSPISPEHVTYVWFDALINYITAAGYGSNLDRFVKWWQDKDTIKIHIIGKDILRHHAVLWPIILKSLSQDLDPISLPTTIFAHGWWVQGGEKMSKSRGNVIDPVEIVKTYGVDPYRYFLLREVPFGQDGTFSEEALIDRFNHDLANDLGNLLHRSLTMCEKYFGGEVPLVSKWDEKLKSLCEELPKKLNDSMNRLAFEEALAEIWQVIGVANKYIETSAPWTLSKEGKTEELKQVIATLMETLYAVATAVWPFIPSTGDAIWKQLGVLTSIDSSTPQERAWGHFNKGGKVAKGLPLFPRIEVEKK